jgi:hypothetical protein
MDTKSTQNEQGRKSMDMRKVTREVRLERWAEILRERQASGKSITAWCEANGMDRQRYFYWQRKLRGLACEALAKREGGAVEGTTEFAEYRPMEIAAVAMTEGTREAACPAIVIHLALGKMEIYSGADRETIDSTLQALRGLC